MKKYNITYLIERDEDGMYIASVPALKGCYSQASSIEELISRVKEAIELYLEDNDEDIPNNASIGVQQIEVIK